MGMHIKIENVKQIQWQMIMEINSFLGSGRSVCGEIFLKIKKSSRKNAEKEQENPGEESQGARSSSRIKSLLLVGVVVCFAVFCIVRYLDVDSPTGDAVFSGTADNYSAPVVLNKSVYPEKVAHGDVLLENIFIEDEYGIESVTGEIEGIDNLKFSLIDGTVKKGTWQNAWIVHTTENMRWYNTTIVIRNVKGETTVTKLLWQDPTVYHPASEVTAGTFDAGNFTFQDNVVVQDNLTVSNNIVVTGTVDGRDVSTDGSKLDGVETGAAANQTDSEILTAIKNVDGSASGLDADTLDGEEGSYYLIPTAYLTSATFQGNHNCDDSPSTCCASGYHMCIPYEVRYRRVETSGTGRDSTPSDTKGDYDINAGAIDCTDWTSTASITRADLLLNANTVQPWVSGSTAQTCDNYRPVWCCSDTSSDLV